MNDPLTRCIVHCGCGSLAKREAIFKLAKSASGFCIKAKQQNRQAVFTKCKSEIVSLSKPQRHHTVNVMCKLTKNKLNQ